MTFHYTPPHSPSAQKDLTMLPFLSPDTGWVLLFPAWGHEGTFQMSTSWMGSGGVSKNSHKVQGYTNHLLFGRSINFTARQTWIWWLSLSWTSTLCDLRLATQPPSPKWCHRSYGKSDTFAKHHIGQTAYCRYCYSYSWNVSTKVGQRLLLAYCLQGVFHFGV